MSQSTYFKSRPDLLTLGGVGGRNHKSWKTLRVERNLEGWNLVGRISTSPRYVIDITGLNPLSLGGGGGVLVRKNLKNRGIFNLQTGDQILMKFDI